MTTFKDEFLHLGGDEVPMTCWWVNGWYIYINKKQKKHTRMHAYTHARTGYFWYEKYLTQMRRQVLKKLVLRTRFFNA